MKPTQEQVIAWAREAGFDLSLRGHPDFPERDNKGNLLFWAAGTHDNFQAAFTLAYEAGRKNENEACAKVCDAAQLFGNIDERWAAKCCSDQIRARREQ